MMAKPVWSIILAVGLVVEAALFVGLGTGAGALSVVASGVPNYQSTPFNLDSALEWQANVTSYTSAGQVPVTAISPGGQSTAVSAAVDIWAPSTPGCNGAANPAFVPGVGADYAYWVISMGGQNFQINYAGHLNVSVSSTYVIPENTSQMFFCDNADGVISYDIGSTPRPFFPISFSLQGVYAPSTLSVAFVGSWTNCDGSTLLGVNGPVCQTIFQALPGLIANWGSANGGGSFSTTASIQTQSGYAWIQDTNPGQLAYNGGLLTLVASTGYAGPSGYTALVDFPQARGGGTDSAFGTASIPNDQMSYQFTMRIPSDASQNSSNPGWNEFTVVLEGQFTYMGSTSAAIDISPLYAPSAPLIQDTINGQFISPQPGDSLSLSFSAQPSAHSANVSAIVVWVFYTSGNSPPTANPACGVDWVSSCPGPTAIPVAQSGGGVKGFYPTFTVSPPPGATVLVVSARSETNTAQASPISTVVIGIVPANCVPGVPGCPPLKTTVNNWTFEGAILLAAMLVTAVALAMMWVPPSFWYLRFGIPIALVVLIAVLWATGNWTSMFQIGGPLGSHL